MNFSSEEIIKKLQALKNTLPKTVKLVAVSKTKPAAAIKAAYDEGQRDFGENKVQELTEKHADLPKDIRWHMIGHLQTNKVKYIVDFVHLIHSVDRLKLLKTIQKEAKKAQKTVPILLQVKIAKEDTKFGFEIAELEEILTADFTSKFPNIQVKGLMGMATLTDNKATIAEEFNMLKVLFDRYKTIFSNLDTLSMGMTGDYEIAIKEGSNLIRVGSAIFGERNYH